MFTRTAAATLIADQAMQDQDPPGSNRPPQGRGGGRIVPADRAGRGGRGFRAGRGRGDPQGPGGRGQPGGGGGGGPPDGGNPVGGGGGPPGGGDPQDPQGGGGFPIPPLEETEFVLMLRRLAVSEATVRFIVLEEAIDSSDEMVTLSTEVVDRLFSRMDTLRVRYSTVVANRLRLLHHVSVGLPHLKIRSSHSG